VKVGVVVFPGSNCDHDCIHAIEHFGHEAIPLWHRQESLKDCEAVILPGGFSYGDYLRSGAIARFSPIMTEVIRFGRSGGLILGICNGFQILLEAGLLPGAMLRNQSLKFVCKLVSLRLENANTPFTHRGSKGQIFTMPVAHGDGNYFADAQTLTQLEENHQIIFRYVNESGQVEDNCNPNGSCNFIAGICNEKGNILGMMPHPERALEEVLQNCDGQMLFSSFLEKKA
jgi:phosphoribosylformylglycinamidine synthase